MKVVENNPQNARNCTFFLNFLGGMPPNPPSNGSHAASRHVYLKGLNFLLFLSFQFFKGGPAQEIAGKIIFPTKKVANYR